MRMELCDSTLRMPSGEYEDDSGDDTAAVITALFRRKQKTGAEVSIQIFFGSFFRCGLCISLIASWKSSASWKLL